MTQLSDDFTMMCRVGYGCGLTTVGEAFSQLCCHYDAFFKIEEANERIGAIASNVEFIENQTIREVMGDAWCDQQDAEEKAYWETQQ